MNITTLIILLTNAIKTNRVQITVKFSKQILPFLEILCKENFILGYTNMYNKEVVIYFFFTYKVNKLLSFKHVSKPSHNTYFSLKDLWKFNKSISTLILSTSFGILSHRQALVRGCGGKVLCVLV